MLYHSRNPHGGDIYTGRVQLDFSANTNPLGTPPGVVQAVQESLCRLHRYPDPYCRTLVQQIAAFEAVSPDYVLCGNGAAELIYSFCEAVRPKRAVEIAPTFSEYTLGLQRVGCVPQRYFLRQETEFTIGPDFLPFLRAQKPDVIFLCNPNNPTGKLMDEAVLRQVLAFCRESGCRLFADECFLDLTDHGKSLKEFLQDTPELLILKAFTKSYGMAGLRLGYCLSADPQLLAGMSAAVPPWNVSTPAQAAGIAALHETQFLQDTRTLIRTQRAWLQTRLIQLGFWVCPSQANFLLFQGPPQLHTQMAQRGISLRNCDNYHGLGPGWYRIAVRLPEENNALISALQQLAEDEKLWQKTL